MNPGPSKQRRHTAKHARLLFETMPTDSESDGSGSDFDDTNSTRSSSTTSSDANDVDQQPVNPPPAKQRRVVNDDLPTWSEVAEAETSNAFRFMPPNGVGLILDLAPESTP
ncbi:hypothetical protein ElyMa_000785800 [Elysia marginata]|uniref:Uncharacterized protein n=1 Tax=Elysia marginata TaxID=1093978 RepID=A0AAV4GUL0_9GAST|nr:hypothetical protein ElyMa_000785800 [Elysia marginata]